MIIITSSPPISILSSLTSLLPQLQVCFSLPFSAVLVAQLPLGEDDSGCDWPVMNHIERYLIFLLPVAFFGLPPPRCWNFHLAWLCAGFVHAVTITGSFQKDAVSLKPSTSSGSYSLSMKILDPCGKECDRSIPFGVENATVSYSPYVDQLRVFVWIAIYCELKLPWGELRDALMYTC